MTYTLVFQYRGTECRTHTELALIFFSVQNIGVHMGVVRYAFAAPGQTGFTFKWVDLVGLLFAN